MDFFNKCAISILLVTVVLVVANVEASNDDETLPGNTENALKLAESVGDLNINTNEEKSRVKRQFGGYYDPYYDRRRPYPPIIFGGIGGFGGYGYGRGFGGRGFGGRGFGGRGVGGRGIGGRGIGGRGIGGRGIGGRGGGVGGGHGGGRG